MNTPNDAGKEESIASGCAHAAMEEQRLIRELRAISDCNRALIRETHEQTLLNEICRIVCDDAGYRMAWVGYAEHDERKSVRPVAWGGVVDGYLDHIDVTWSDTEEGNGPAGICIRSRQYCYIDDFASNPLVAKWRSAALARGYRSSIAFPLLDDNGNALGALLIYSTQPEAFNPEENRLLSELADNLAFGINSLRSRAEHKQAMAALSHSHDLMRYIIEHNRSAIAVHDREMKYIYVSQRYLDEYHVEERDIIGKHHYEIFPNLPQKWRDVHQRCLAGAVCSAEDDPYVREDGTVEWTRWECRPWHEASGSIGGIIIYTEVITERKQAEEQLRMNEEKFRALFEQAGDYILILDPNPAHGPVIIDANASACRMHGYTRDELIGMSILELDDNISEADSEDLSRRIMTGEAQRFETIHRRKDGTRFPIEVCAKLVRLSNGTSVIFTTERDLSERVRAEDERARLQAQLIQAQKMESVGRLAGGVAHDFNNMLSVILGYAEMAQMQVDASDPLYEDLVEIQNAAQRSADLTRQLLAFARKQTVMPSVLNLNDAIEGILKMLKRLIGENIQLHWQPEPALWLVKMDPSQVDQILANLCVNARDAIADVGTITIKTENLIMDAPACTRYPEVTPGEYVILSVSDNGCGMDQQTLAQIFEPFFTTKGIGRGTGLGLATVYGAIQQNNGFIDATSTPGLGTTLTIYLPRYAGETGTVEQDNATQTSKSGHETIMLVEDEPAILNLVRKVLQEQGYTVIAAATPNEALRLVREHVGRIHLLITDVVMPEMNGQELAHQLLSYHPQLRRLYMSGYSSDVLSQQGLLEEGVYYLQKPFSMNMLSDKIRDALDNGWNKR